MITPSALLLQLIGHAKYSPNLNASDVRHGLLAAPVLEVGAGWVRGEYGGDSWGRGMGVDRIEVLKEAKGRRETMERGVEGRGMKTF